jgi:hypothetical protein
MAAPIVRQAVPVVLQSLLSFPEGETYQKVEPGGVGLPLPPKLHPLEMRISKRIKKDPVNLEMRNERCADMVILPILVNKAAP